MPDTIEPFPDWLRRSALAIRDRCGRNGVALAKGGTLLSLLQMVELDDLPAPVIVGTRDTGITAVWTAGTKQFALRVVADLVEFSSWRDGRPREIPAHYLRIGRAGLIRERLGWLFGYHLYPSRLEHMLAAAQGDPQ